MGRVSRGHTAGLKLLRCDVQTVAEVQTEAAQARSSAVVALVARAERLHALRNSAISDALDWLQGDLPADEVFVAA